MMKNDFWLRGVSIGRTLWVSVVAAVPCVAMDVDTVNLENLRLSRPGEVVAIQPGVSFSVGHPGTLTAEFTLSSSVQEPSGTYSSPKLQAYWRIEDGAGYALGGHEWNGGSSEVLATYLLWDSSTGTGTAEISLPIGGYNGFLEHYPMFPVGSAQLSVVFGEPGVLHLDAQGQPQGYGWEGGVSLLTDMPSAYAIIEEQPIRPGESTYFSLVFKNPLLQGDVITLSCVGPGIVRPAGESSGKRWDVVVPAGSAAVGVVFWAHEVGTFGVVAQLSDGTVIGSQLSEVTVDLPTLMDVGALSSAPDPGGPVDPGPDPELTESDKYCRPAFGAPANGEKVTNCTRPFVELIEDPINPSCTGEKVLIVETKCKDARDAQCAFDGEVWVEGAGYQYLGTVDRPAGEVQVELGYHADGEVGFKLVGTVSAGWTFSAHVMSPVTKRCCKYGPMGEPRGRYEPKCAQF